MNEAKEENLATKFSRRKRPLVAVLSAFFVIFASVYAWSIYVNRYIPGKITFQQYAPTYWPSGLDIKEKVINAEYVPSQEPPRYTELVLEMADGSVVSEIERRREQQLIYKCPDGEVKNRPCIFGYTSKGEPYLLHTSSFDGVVADQTIEWSRKDTDITVNLKNVPDGGYQKEEIEKIIKSFKPVEYKNLEIRHIDRSVI